MRERIVDEFAARMPHTWNQETRDALLLLVLAEFGYRWFVHALIPINRNCDLKEFLSNGNLDHVWMGDYISNGLFKYDPLTWWCLVENKPWLWSAMYVEVDRLPRKSPYRTTNDLARDMRFHNGATFPLIARGNFKAGMSLFADPSMPQAKHDEDFRKNQRLLNRIVKIYHNHVDRKRLAQLHYNLNDKQLEALSLLTLELERDEVAARMGRSAGSIDNDLHTAFRALDVNCIQAATTKLASLEALPFPPVQMPQLR